MKTIKLLLLSFSLLLLTTQTGLAAESEATVSAEKIRQETLDRIRRALDKLSLGESEAGQPRLKAFIGQVDSLTGNTLSVVSKENGGSVNKQVLTDDATEMIRGGRSIEFADIGLGNDVIAMGVTSDNQTLTALRIVVDEFKEDSIITKIVTGTISSFDLRTRELVLDTDDTDVLGKEVIISRRAEIVDGDLNELELTELEEGIRIIAIVEIDTEDDVSVTYKLMVYPNLSIPTPTITSTSSCGDGICQNTVCQGEGCPTPESPQNCPADCGQ